MWGPVRGSRPTTREDTAAPRGRSGLLVQGVHSSVHTCPDLRGVLPIRYGRNVGGGRHMRRACVQPGGEARARPPRVHNPNSQPFSSRVHRSGGHPGCSPSHMGVAVFSHRESTRCQECPRRGRLGAGKSQSSKCGRLQSTGTSASRYSTTCHIVHRSG